MAVTAVNLNKLATCYKQVALIDLSWVLHRSMHVFRNFTVSPVPGTEVPTGHMYGSLMAVQSFLQQEDMAVVVVRDGHPVERIQQSQEAGVAYKADRPELEYDFYKDVPKIINMALACGDVYYAYNADKESDDVMYCIAKKLEEINPTLSIWIHSGDNDLLQTINKKGTIKVCRTFDGGKMVPIGYDEVVNLEQFTKKFHGVGPDKIVLFRAVVGDSSDNIKGIPRFPRDILKSLVMRSETLDDLFVVRVGDSASMVKNIQRLCDNESTVRSNYGLMKLRDDFVPNVVKSNVPKEWVERQLTYYKLTRWDNYLKRIGFYNL